MKLSVYKITLFTILSTFLLVHNNAFAEPVATGSSTPAITDGYVFQRIARQWGATSLKHPVPFNSGFSLPEGSIKPFDAYPYVDVLKCMISKKVSETSVVAECTVQGDLEIPIGEEQAWKYLGGDLPLNGFELSLVKSSERLSASLVQNRAKLFFKVKVDWLSPWDADLTLIETKRI